MTLIAIAAASPVLAVVAGDDRAAVERAVARAERTWDTAGAVEALSRARTLHRNAPSPGAVLLQVRAGLLAAELLRVEFEQARGAASPDRDTLGQRIDASAEEALALVSSLPASSERWRIEADLVATMIRSDFRARKHEARLRAAIAEARRLDPGNARAIVSEAKPFLFAPPEHGRDLRAGIALLDRALALDPKLEPALLLRAFARDGLGERAAAEADWRAALALNPDCRPAEDALASRPPR
jgi:tetratricopeptide (TPR) repeat protein